MRPPDMLPLPTDTPPIRPGPPGGELNGNAASGPMSPMFMLDGMNLGREKLTEWTPAVWARIDEAAVCEIDRASVAAQFLPKVPSLTPSVRTVPANRIADARNELSIDQRNVLPLLEESQLFFLSKEQYYEEEAIGTAATLASRAANRLARAMDAAIFQGAENPSLVSVAAGQRTVTVQPLDPAVRGVYGENVFRAVAEAYAFLQGLNLYGPYALVLPPEQYADAHAPLPTTLIMPARPDPSADDGRVLRLGHPTGKPGRDGLAGRDRGRRDRCARRHRLYPRGQRRDPPVPDLRAVHGTDQGPAVLGAHGVRVSAR